jgi:hypothetical protein
MDTVEHPDPTDGSHVTAGSDDAAGLEDAAGPDSADSVVAGLTAREVEVLAFERQWWKYAGAKEQAVRELFDLSATRYYQVLNALIDTPAALAHDPMLVKRLRRLRRQRQQGRSTRRLDVHGPGSVHG